MQIKKYKILIAAIGISLGWHLFWISVVKVVASPIPAKTVRFGAVSFLGPMASRSGMEFKLSPKRRSFLEKRYLSRLGAVEPARIITADAGYAGCEPESYAENGITDLIANAVAGTKEELNNAM